MEDSSISFLKDYWFEELGCAPKDLMPGQVLVVKHGRLKGYRGVLFFLHREACVVSAPEALVNSLSEQTAGMNSLSCFSVETATRLLGSQLDRLIGPAWIGQLNLASFCKQHGAETRLLSTAEHGALEDLLAACPPEEASHSALEPGRSPTVGIFREGKLVASAGYEVLEKRVAHIGVLVHPSWRGQGLAIKVVSGIAETALQSKLGVQYRTLYANPASLAAARKVGFQDFAKTIAARLR
jgi:GNAT superfamily N-acetyltransferase